MENNVFERTPEFEQKVADQEHNTFKTKELDLMTQEEFDKVIPATGPAKPEEAELIRKRSMEKMAEKNKAHGPAMG